MNLDIFFCCFLVLGCYIFCSGIDILFCVCMFLNSVESDFIDFKYFIYYFLELLYLLIEMCVVDFNDKLLIVKF